MTHLITVPTNHIAVTATATTEATTTSTTGPNHITLWALTGHMTRYIAQVANRLVLTVPGQVACLPAVFACLIVCTISSKMALFVTVVAESQVTGRQLRVGALSSTVARFATGVADALVRAAARHVAWLSTVVA